jgi:multiple sugar transport system permease protein
LKPRPHLLALAPALAVLAALAVYPTAYLVRLAVSDWTPDAPVPVFAGAKHLRRALFGDVFFWKSLGLTLVYTAAALAAELALGLALALLLVGHPRPGPSYRSEEPQGALFPWLRTALGVPMTLTPVVVGLSWRILFDPDLGPLDRALGALGVTGPAWVADPRWALTSLVLVDVWQWTPFMVLALGAALSQLPRELYEAAAVDGAGRLVTLRHVTLPGLRRAMMAAALLRAVDLFKAFDILFIVTEGGPGTATETLNLYVFRVLRRFDIGYAAALGLCLLAATLIFSRLLQRLLGDPLQDEEPIR